MHWTQKLTPAQKTTYFETIRKKVKNPGFKGNSELARKAANKRWQNVKDKPDGHKDITSRQSL